MDGDTSTDADADADAQTVSILLLGDSDVGKSTFLTRWGAGAGAGPLLHDADQPFVVALRTRVRRFRLAFSDTASPEHWRLLHPDMVVLCFDIARRPTLAALPAVWLRAARAAFAHRDSLPLLVLGLKRDLRHEDDPDCVLPHEAYNLAQQLRADMYLECSAATGELLPEVLEDLTTRAIRTTEDGGQSEGGCCVM